MNICWLFSALASGSQQEQFENLYFYLRQSLETSGYSLDEQEFAENIKELLEFHAVVQPDGTYTNTHCQELASVLKAWHEDQDFLKSLQLHTIIGKYIRRSCRRNRYSSELETFVSNCELCQEEGKQLVHALVMAIKTKFVQRKPRRVQTGSPAKFSELCLGNQQLFHHGLEHVIGFPATKKFMSATCSNG